MASIFTHAVAAAALGVAFHRPGWSARFWALGAACAIVPDADVVGLPLGVPFYQMFGHRGVSHSLVFAAVLAAVAVALGVPRGLPGASRASLWLYFFLATASHGVLDALTNGGPGVAFFAPFDDTRYVLPWRPIVVSPIGIRPFFSAWGARVIVSELWWVWLPSLVFACLALIARRRSERRWRLRTR